MVKIELRGIAKVRSKGRTYWYAWRGGPRLEGEPGSAAFIESYQEAHRGRIAPDDGRFRSLIALYRASGDYNALADSTKRNWSPWLDRLADYFGDLRIAQFDRPEKIRPVIRRWRNTYASTPRAADYGMQVLSRVLSYAVDPLGKIAGNPCVGIKQLYSGTRADRIWTEADIARLKQTCSAEIAHAVDLAAHTGLRLGDLLRLSWSHVGSDEIVITTGKSRHRREAIIPLYGALQDVLARIPKRSPTVLTNSHGRPWRRFDSSFQAARAAAGMADADLHFHDLRGTAATRFYTAGLPERVIAEIMGWEEEHVAGIIRRYVGRSAATRAIIRLLDKQGTENNRETNPAKPAAKPASTTALST
jgi:integrase